MHKYLADFRRLYSVGNAEWNETKNDQITHSQASETYVFQK